MEFLLQVEDLDISLSGSFDKDLTDSSPICSLMDLFVLNRPCDFCTVHSF